MVRIIQALICSVVLFLAGAQPAWAALPSWNPGNARTAIESFVRAVTSPGPDFVPEDRRVAVFDNDGTLWTEQPMYTELAFTLDRAAAMARADPELALRPAFQIALSRDPARRGALDHDQFLELVTATHSGMTVEEFAEASADWLAQARHPQTGRPYPQSIYQPMVELMNLLRANGFEVFIVSGGDRDFIRAFSDTAYGVPPWQVIGSSNETALTEREGVWTLERTPQPLGDDGPDKARNIALQIGVRPIFAAGNSDGDLQMLQYSTSGPGPRFGLLVHHDDAAREYAYDRDSRIGRLDAALDAAGPAGWTVVSIRNDWRTVFPVSPTAR